MKNKYKLCAKALADLALDRKNAKRGKEFSDNFLCLLEKNRDLEKAKAIISLTEEIILKKNGNHKILVEVARNLGKNNFMKEMAKKRDVLIEKINPALVAGVKIVVDNEKELDFSLIKKLENIF